MTISAELLNTTYRSLKGPLEHTWMRRTPFLDAVVNAGGVKETHSGNTTYEFVVADGSPATGRGHYSGFELYNLTRRKITLLGKLEPHKIGGAIAIPGNELDLQNGSGAVLKLIDEYPAAFTASANLCMEAFCLTSKVPAGGNPAFPATELAGFSTFYGPWTSGRRVGVENGILQQASEAAQSLAGTAIHSIASSTTSNWVNQYELMASWTTEGEDKLGKIIRRCGHYSIRGRKFVGFVCPDTMTNLVKSRRSHARSQKVEQVLEDSDQSVMEFSRVKFHESLDMDRTLFTGDPAADGWGYVFNLTYIKIPIVKAMALDDFKDRTADQDGVVSKFSYHAVGPVCTHRASQGVFTGSAL